MEAKPQQPLKIEHSEELYDIYESHPLASENYTIQNIIDNIGFVQLVDMMPRKCPKGRTAEYRSVQAARASYGLGLKDIDADVNFINYLMRSGHTSPNEQIEFTFMLHIPLACAVQILRHRTAKQLSINQESGRYSIVKDEFYIPNMRFQSETNKQGSKDTVPTPEEQKVLDDMKAEFRRVTEESYKAYNLMIKNGVAKEIARFVLGTNSYTTLYFKMDLHNLLHFFSLRCDPHAQWETRMFANAMYDLVKPMVPDAMRAFENYILNGVKFSSKEQQILKTMLQKTHNTELQFEVNASKLNQTEKKEFMEKIAKIAKS